MDYIILILPGAEVTYSLAKVQMIVSGDFFLLQDKQYQHLYTSPHLVFSLCLSPSLSHKHKNQGPLFSPLQRLLYWVPTIFFFTAERSPCKSLFLVQWSGPQVPGLCFVIASSMTKRNLKYTFQVIAEK